MKKCDQIVQKGQPRATPGGRFYDWPYYMTDRGGESEVVFPALRNMDVVDCFTFCNGIIEFWVRNLSDLTEINNTQSPETYLNNVVLGTHHKFTDPDPEDHRHKQLQERILSQCIDKNNILDPASLAEKDRTCAIFKCEYTPYSETVSAYIYHKANLSTQQQIQERTALASYLRNLSPTPKLVAAMHNTRGGRRLGSRKH